MKKSIIKEFLIFLFILLFPILIFASDSMYYNTYDDLYLNNAAAYYSIDFNIGGEFGAHCLTVYEPFGNYNAGTFTNSDIHDFLSTSDCSSVSYNSPYDEVSLGYSSYADSEHTELNSIEWSETFYYGCNDPEATNFDATHVTSTGPCEYTGTGTSTATSTAQTTFYELGILTQFFIVFVLCIVLSYLFIFKVISAHKNK